MTDPTSATTDDFSFSPCLYELTGLTDERVRFVHGTAADFNPADGVQAWRGGGDFGLGFYTYLASGPSAGWGAQKASAWALRKAKPQHPALRNAARIAPCTPRLIYVSLARVQFDSLTKDLYDEHTCQEAYKRLYRDKETGKDVVIGPVGMRGDYGKIADHSLPCQFKFEASCVALLTVDEVFDLKTDG